MDSGGRSTAETASKVVQSSVLFSDLDGATDDLDGAANGVVTLDALHVMDSGSIVVDTSNARFEVAGDVGLSGNGAIKPLDDGNSESGPNITIDSAGSIRLVGTSTIMADGVSGGGSLVLCAAETIELRGTSSLSASATGPVGVGGLIRAQAGHRLTLDSGASRVITGGTSGGTIKLIACGAENSAILIKGRLDARGTNSDGGTIDVTSRQGGIKVKGPPNRMNASGSDSDGVISLTAGTTVSVAPRHTTPPADILPDT